MDYVHLSIEEQRAILVDRVTSFERQHLNASLTAKALAAVAKPDTAAIGGQMDLMSALDAMHVEVVAELAAFNTAHPIPAAPPAAPPVPEPPLVLPHGTAAPTV